MREPCVAGQFYEDDFQGLNKQIEDSFNGDRGPGTLPLKRKDTDIKAIISPHAGYMYSGQCAAWAYKEIAERNFARTYIILGPNHRNVGSGISIEDWNTPFGAIKTDKALAQELKEKTDLKIDESVHINEHSIEVQLPFLQFACRDKLSGLKILPIAIDRDIEFQKLGTDIKNVIANKDVVIIVSSDFTHYGMNYGYLPFSSDVQERLNKLDKEALGYITSLDIAGFSEFLNKTHDTICGFYPILVLMSILEGNDVKGSLLMHYTSGDLSGDYSNSVSYASILFKQ